MASKPNENPSVQTDEAQQQNASNPLMSELISLMRHVAGTVPAPVGPQAPCEPASSTTTPGGKFLVNGRWVFCDGTPWSAEAVPPLHNGHSSPAMSSFAVPVAPQSQRDGFVSQVKAASATTQPIPRVGPHDPNAALPGTSI